MKSNKHIHILSAAKCRSVSLGSSNSATGVFLAHTGAIQIRLLLLFIIIIVLNHSTNIQKLYLETCCQTSAGCLKSRNLQFWCCYIFTGFKLRSTLLYITTVQCSAFLLTPSRMTLNDLECLIPQIKYILFVDIQMLFLETCRQTRVGWLKWMNLSYYSCFKFCNIFTSFKLRSTLLYITTTPCLGFLLTPIG